MGFLDALRKLLGGGGSGSAPGATGVVDPHGLWFHVRCKRCGSVVRMRVDKRNDLNREEGGPGALLLRKEVMDGRCFQLMHAEIWLDDNYGVVKTDITGGELVSEREYLEAQGRGEPS